MAVKSLVKNFYKYKIPIFLIIALNFISYKSLSNTNQDFDNHSPQHIKIPQDNSTNFDESFIYQDWVNDPKPDRACPGYFRSPSIPQVLKPEISADTFEFAKEGTSVLNGNVVYLDQKNKVSANQALVYRDNKLNKVTKIKAQGNIEYLTDDIRVIGNLININVLNNMAVIDSPSYFSFYPRNARGHAQKSVLIKDQSYTIYDSSFTTCPLVIMLGTLIQKK